MGTTTSRPAGGAWRTVAAAIAAGQGLALIGNGLAVAFFVLRDGITGPSSVASPAGVTLEIVLFLLFGGALLAVARGLHQGRPGVLTPFLLAQLLGLTVGVPLLSAPDGVRAVGVLVVATCALGIASWFVLLRSSVAGAAGGAPDRPAAKGS
jgi:hypothetical protein